MKLKTAFLYFGTDKIQNLIQNQAVKEIKSKINDIVDEQIQNMSAINDAASEMRIGRPTGLEKLKMFFTHPLSKQDSLQEKKIIQSNYTGLCKCG